MMKRLPLVLILTLSGLCVSCSNSKQPHLGVWERKNPDTFLPGIMTIIVFREDGKMFMKSRGEYSFFDYEMDYSTDPIKVRLVGDMATEGRVSFPTSNTMRFGSSDANLDGVEGVDFSEFARSTDEQRILEEIESHAPPL